MKTVYADNNATTPVAPEVMEAMTPYFTGGFYNPSAISGRVYGVDTAIAINRRTMEEFLGGQTQRRLLQRISYVT